MILILNIKKQSFKSDIFSEKLLLFFKLLITNYMLHRKFPVKF